MCGPITSRTGALFVSLTVATVNHVTAEGNAAPEPNGDIMALCKATFSAQAKMGLGHLDAPLMAEMSSVLVSDLFVLC